MKLVEFYDRYSKFRLFWFIYVMSYVFLGLVVGSLSVTFIPQTPPVRELEGSICALRKGDIIEVSYTRKAESFKEIIGIVHKEIVNTSTGWMYEIPGFHRQFKPGEHVSKRMIVLPGSAPNGNYQLKTYLIWRPNFALADQMFELPPMRFKICDEDEVCK